MTDAEKVELCNMMLADYFGALGVEGIDAIRMLVKSIGTVLDFGEERDKDG